MLTEVTALRTQGTSEIRSAAPRKRMVHVPLLLFRRILDTAAHEAKKTHNGEPTKVAVLERTWFEQHCEPGWLGWEASFSNCCLMLEIEESASRRGFLREIDRAWAKALTDWGRRRRNQILEEIMREKAADNPAWAKMNWVQEYLPIPES